MNVRIVVANERKAEFFDAYRPGTPLNACGTLENPTGGKKDSELETDRPGRRMGGGQGQPHHHGVDGERSTEQHELTLFAKVVGQRIDADRIGHRFDRLVLVAPPKMLGLIRQALPVQSQSLLASEISKDLLHHGPEAVMNAVPRETFWTV